MRVTGEEVDFGLNKTEKLCKDDEGDEDKNRSSFEAGFLRA